MKAEVEAWLPKAMKSLEKQKDATADPWMRGALLFSGRIFELVDLIHRLEVVLLGGLKNGDNWFVLKEEVLRGGIEWQDVYNGMKTK